MFVIRPCVGSAMARELGDLTDLVGAHLDDGDAVFRLLMPSKVSGTPM